MTDLGDRTYLAALDAASAPELYADAIDALIRWQRAHARRRAAAVRRSAAHGASSISFPTGTSRRHLGIAARRRRRRQRSRDAFRLILDNNLAQPRVFVHRDYHSRNLMVTDAQSRRARFPGRRRTARSPTTSSRCCATPTSRGTRSGRSTGRCATGSARARAGLPVDADFGAFWRDFEWMGVQRQLKVLGIFARLAHRDGKRGYLDDMPRVMAYLRARVRALWRARIRSLALLDELDDRAPRVGTRSR